MLRKFRNVYLSEHFCFIFIFDQWGAEGTGRILLLDTGHGGTSGQTTWMHLAFWRLHRSGLSSPQSAGPAEAGAGATNWQHVSPGHCIHPKNNTLCRTCSDILPVHFIRAIVLNRHVTAHVLYPGCGEFPAVQRRPSSVFLSSFHNSS